MDFWRAGKELGLPAATNAWNNEEIQHLLRLRESGSEDRQTEGVGRERVMEGGRVDRKRGRETEREKELEREVRLCRARLAVQGEMMMGVVKVKQETSDAKASAEAQRKDAQEALAHAAAARRAELQALHAQMAQLAAKMLEDEEAMECSVCMETGASTALIPWCVIVQLVPAVCARAHISKSTCICMYSARR